jgi:hypothetical protein
MKESTDSEGEVGSDSKRARAVIAGSERQQGKARSGSHHAVQRFGQSAVSSCRAHHVSSLRRRFRGDACPVIRDGSLHDTPPGRLRQGSRFLLQQAFQFCAPSCALPSPGHRV